MQGIPLRTLCLIAAQDFSNPVSYPMFSTVAAGYPAQVKYFAGQGVKSVAIIVINIPEGIAAADLTLVKPFAAAGVKAVSIPATPGAADMTPYVQQALRARPQVLFMLQDQSGAIVNEYSGTEFSEVMTLQTICKSLGTANCTAANVLSTVKAPHNIPVFMGKALNASTPVLFADAPTHVFNPWVRSTDVH
jgi:Periplasmic binding protein